jgi:mRNA turnover protein 4
LCTEYIITITNIIIFIILIIYFIRYFSSFSAIEYAVAGDLPNEEIALEPGLLPFPVSMTNQLRSWGLIVDVQDSALYLRERLVIATPGSPLTPEQAKLLMKLEKPLGQFTMELVCAWEDGQFREL